MEGQQLSRFGFFGEAWCVNKVEAVSTNNQGRGGASQQGRGQAYSFRKTKAAHKASALEQLGDDIPKAHQGSGPGAPGEVRAQSRELDCREADRKNARRKKYWYTRSINVTPHCSYIEYVLLIVASTINVVLEAL